MLERGHLSEVIFYFGILQLHAITLIRAVILEGLNYSSSSILLNTYRLSLQLQSN